MFRITDTTPRYIAILALIIFLSPAISVANNSATPETGGPANPAPELLLQLEEHPSDPTLLYNYGVTLYQNGQYQQAAKTFAKGVSFEKKEVLRAEARYNQARSLFAQAAKSEGLKEKKQLLHQAETVFHQALEDNPTLTIARRGIQETRKALKEISPQQKQAPDQQQQQDKEGKENAQKQLNQASKKQQELNKKNDPSAKPGSAQDMQKMAQEQKGLRKQLEELQKKLSAEEQDNKQAEQVQKAIDKQKKAEEALKQGRIDQAKKQQEEAAQHLQQATKNSGDKDEEQSQKKEALAPTSPSLADDILENERRLHELRREQLRRSRPYKGKDW